MPAYRTRRLPLVTTAPKAWLAYVRLFPGRTLGMDARLTMCPTRYTQERQFVETDIQAWILGSKVSRLPHCSQKHAPGGRIVATLVRCLTGLLICFPRRLGRECPDHAPPYTRQQPYPRVHHPDSPQPLASAFIHVHYGLALYVDGTARRQAPGAGKALTHSRALPMIAFSCHDATSDLLVLCAVNTPRVPHAANEPGKPGSTPPSWRGCCARLIGSTQSPASLAGVISPTQ